MSLYDDIKSIESRDTSADQIKKALDGNVKIILYQDISNVYDIKNLFNESNHVVIDYPVNSRFSGHFVCMIYKQDKNQISYFDPYGFNERQDIKNAKWLRHNESLSNQLSLPYLFDKFTKQGGTIDYNTIRYQEISGQISTCARHCVTRLLKSELTNREYFRWLVYKDLNPDEIVSLLTIGLM